MEIVKAFKKDEAFPFGLTLLIYIYYIIEEEIKEKKLLEEYYKEGLSFVNKYKLGKTYYEKFYKDIISNNYRDDETYWDWLFEISEKVASKIKKIDRDTSLSQDNVKFVKDISLFIRKDSIPALKRILKYLKEAHIPNKLYVKLKEVLPEAVEIEEEIYKELTKDIKKATKGIQSKQKELEKLVKYFTGKKALDMLPEDRKKAKEKSEEKYKEFLKHRRELNEDFKRVVEELVLKSGKDKIKIKEVYKYCKKHKIQCLLPENLDNLLIDRNLNIYTEAGLKIDGKPPYNAKITLNPNYNPKEDNSYVFKALLPNGNELAYYTENYKRKARKKKFGSVSEVIDDIDKYREKWVKDLLSSNKEKQLLALIVELLYETQARIGSLGQKTKKDGKTYQTYGLTTLKRKHIKFLDDGSVVLSYLGKKAVRQKHIIQPKDKITKQVVKLLKQLAKDKDKEDWLFTYKRRRIPADKVNKYIKEDLGMPISAHKFRHIIGTKLAKQLLLENNPFKGKKISEKKVVDWFKKQLTKIGKQLGHITGEKVSWTTAKDNYIDPEVMIEFFNQSNVRLPKFMKKFEED